ncbi:MAG: outer membrane protein transport protein [Gammaproteobacteria bacterium]|nr:outer membrane protein transport protein [Gammaproteobacteria bacterium]
MKIRILVIASMCLSTSAFAGGYRVALQGQKALGMGHTGVAMTDSSEAVFFNPAAMTFLENDMDVSGGITLIDSVIKYQNQTANVAAETDNPMGTPVSFYISQRENEKLSYGLGIYTPYGNAVEWQKDWAGSHLVNNIELHAIYIQPTISYKLSDDFSVGFGPTIVSGSVDFNRNLSTSLIDANGDRSNVTLKASNVTAIGYNVGFLVKPSNDLSVGISYRSKVVLNARDESADFANIPASLQAAYFDTTFNADLVLPAELTVGVSYNLNSDLVLALDINRTYWSAYENLDVQFNNAAGTSLNPRNYNDANIVRLGAQYAMGEDLTLRAGMYFDNSPIGDGYYTPETARADSVGYTAGASYKVSKQMELDFSFLMLTFDEFNGSYDYYDQSGTLVSFSGDYASSVTTIGFGLNYKY